jgi:hypothetical protein
MGQGASFLPAPSKEGSKEMSRATGKVLKSIFFRTFARGKATNLLTVVVALTLATLTPAIAANGGNFLLGKANVATAVTLLKGTVAGPALQVYNPSTSSAATAVLFQVAAGHPPFKVNSATKVPNLNADKVDSQSFTCPSNTLFHEGVCIEKLGRGPNTFSFGAQADCLDESKRLPTIAELQTFRNRSGQNFSSSTGEWTSLQDVQSGLVTTVSPDGTLGLATDNAMLRYRCVVPPS